MCMFTLKHETIQVQDTRIFARNTGAQRQFLAYQMTYTSETRVTFRGRSGINVGVQHGPSVIPDFAMILPLPVPPRSSEEAVRFIDLSGYEQFFADLDQGYPPPPQMREPQKPRDYEEEDCARMSLRSGHEPLRVHDIGSYEASFVPRLKDFNRLDERFRLSPQVWQQLPQYSDYGFAVFKLKPGARKMHPMAFEFPLRPSLQLFFPTIHVHDGTVHKEAVFAHTLYSQAARSVQGWETSFRLPPLAESPAPDLYRWHNYMREPLERYDAACGRDGTMDRLVKAALSTFGESTNEMRLRFKLREPEAIARVEAVEPELRALRESKDHLYAQARQRYQEAQRGYWNDQALLNQWHAAEKLKPANCSPARNFVRIEQTAGIAAPDLPVQRHPLRGLFKNSDVTVSA